jgi:hypothetical protein
MITPPLPLNQTTRVRIEANGPAVVAYLNGTFSNLFVPPSPRIFGEAFFYIGDPWYDSADATISNYDLHNFAGKALLISMIPPISNLQSESPLAMQYYGQTIVPRNYRLIFDITPLSTIPTWGSILHLTSDGTDMGVRGSRMPAIFMTPGNSALHVRTDGETYSNAGYDTRPLPLNQKTTVVIEAMNNLFMTFFNGTMVGIQVLPSLRISGLAHLFVSDPFYPAANARISNLQLLDLSSNSNSPLQVMSKLRTEFPLSVEYYGQVRVPQNYRLIFDITPVATIPTWGSIIHYTVDATDLGVRGSRMPAIFMTPGGTALHIRTDGESYSNAGYDTPSLPLNAKTNVMVQAIDDTFFTYFNGSLVNVLFLATKRITGLAHLFIADPFYPPANALLGNIRLEEWASSRVASNLSEKMNLEGRYFGRVHVPADYILTFNITPSAIIPRWGSIIHYTKDGTDMNRMPAIFTHPSSLRLHIRVDGATYQNSGIDTDIPLPLNSVTLVRIEAVGTNLKVSFNDTLIGSTILPSARTNGDAHLFVSDPFYDATRASVVGISMVAKQ